MLSKRWDCMKVVKKMSKLEQLLTELCPNGVEYRKLEDCCEILDNKRKPVTKSIRETGKYPYYGANGIQDYVANYIFDGNFVLVGEDGSVVTELGTPIVTWATGKIWVNNHAHVISEKKGILLRYIFHYLQNVSVKHLIHGNIPKLTGSDFRAIKILIPPLPVQEEIVRILDKFTELTTKLTTELTTELTTRRQQYEYYRYSLLSKYINRKSLKQISLSSRTGGTPLKSNRAYYENGTIPWLRTQEVVFNEINNTECFITELAVHETSAKWIPANCLIVAISGASAGRCAINKIPLTTNQHCLAIQINPEVALCKYVFYCVCNQFEDLIAKKEGARGDLNSTRILGLEIPIPYPEDKKKSLIEQQRIVDILESFNRLCSDSSEGLAAEIEARQKQYEYYRNRLLTFKKKVVIENE